MSLGIVFRSQVVSTQVRSQVTGDSKVPIPRSVHRLPNSKIDGRVLSDSVNGGMFVLDP
jgi:hypothetical protein